MESAIQITPTGDIETLSTRYGVSMRHIVNLDKIAQDLTIILKTIKGSYPLNPDFGVDYRAIIETGYNETFIRTKISEALRTHPHIKEIISLRITRPGSDRSISIHASLLTTSNKTLDLSTDLPLL